MAVFSGYSGEAAAKRFMLLVDGENMVLRYQDMLASKQPRPNLVHIPDVLVWERTLPIVVGWSVVRVNYYTSATGADEKIAELEVEISKLAVQRNREVDGRVCPRVFKKEAKSKKTRLVDISICIDALRHSYHRDVDAIYLLTGDGDYLPLIKEVMRNGTQVWLGGFSSGLNSKLPSAVDRFIDLDPIFFRASG
jgi:uncharacterized LabA/DUF88 family protein